MGKNNNAMTNRVVKNTQSEKGEEDKEKKERRMKVH